MTVPAIDVTLGSEFRLEIELTLAGLTQDIVVTAERSRPS
jgi:hypothetical protein